MVAKRDCSIDCPWAFIRKLLKSIQQELIKE